MNLLCECGIHDWGKWEYYQGVFHYELDGKRVGEDFELAMRKRECKKCGLVQEKRKND